MKFLEPGSLGELAWDGKLNQRGLHQDETMRLFEKCPVCGGDLVAKEVEKVLKGGTNTAVVKVKAEV